MTGLPGGELGIVAIHNGRSIESVAIHNHRRQIQPHWFTGKPVEALIETLPLVFNVCGVAHSVALISAAEKLMGLTPSVSALRARELLVIAESARELVLGLVRNWLDCELDIAARISRWFSACKQELSWALHPGAAGELQLNSGYRDFDHYSMAAGLEAVLVDLFDSPMPQWQLTSDWLYQRPLGSADILELFDNYTLNLPSRPLNLNNVPECNA